MITPTAVELFFKRVARMWRFLFGGTPHNSPTIRPSSVTKFPQEIVDVIIIYLIYDIRHTQSPCGIPISVVGEILRSADLLSWGGSKMR